MTMPHFVIYALDKLDGEAARLEQRAAHRARLRDHDHPVSVQVGGPLLDTDGRMIGSLLIVEATSKAAVEAFVAGDPYQLADVYGSVRVHPFNWGLGHPAGAGAKNG
jgi:uncharacterized protein YciI